MAKALIVAVREHYRPTARKLDELLPNPQRTTKGGQLPYKGGIVRETLAALLILAATVAWAEWVKANETEQLVKVAENKSWDFYIDRATLRKEGSFRIVSEIWDMKETPKHVFHPDTRSMRATIEYDCQRRFFSPRKLAAYSGQMGKGQILREEAEHNSGANWLDAMMSMPGASVVQLVCSQ